MIKNIVIAILAITTILFGILYMNSSLRLGGASGTFHSFFEEFAAGFNVGSSSITPTSISGYTCNSNTAYNPASIASSSVSNVGYTSTTIGVKGAKVGDIVFVSFATTTSGSQWNINGKITASAASASEYATATIQILNLNTNAALDLATSTLKVCVLN